MTKHKIYTIDNPMWLSDRFVFQQKEHFTCYIKMNCFDKIEDIGIDISERLHNMPMQDIISISRLSNDDDKRKFRMIDREYWYKIFNRMKIERGVKLGIIG